MGACCLSDPEPAKRMEVLMGFAVLYVLISLIIVCAVISIFDINRFVVRRYEITDSRCKRDFRIVQISDLHDKSYGRGNASLIDRIDGLAPDLILMTGDIMTADRHREKDRNADALVLSLAGRYPVYFSLGNHEDKMKNRPDRFGDIYAEAAACYCAAGVHILDNESIDVEDYGLRISGLSFKREFFKHLGSSVPEVSSVRELIGSRNTDNMQILLAHNPLFFDTYVSWGADLVLAGHVHGGIIRIPGLGGMLSPDCTFFPKYDGGMFRKDGTTMIVSRGLGTHSLPVRINNPGELVCIDVRRQEVRS